MSIHQIIARWLAARTMQVVESRIRNAAIEAISDRTGKPEEAIGENVPKLTCEDAPGVTDTENVVDIGFVFALPMEAVGVVDFMKRKKTIKADGRLFHTGLFGRYRIATVFSGVGQENAARAAEVLIDTFRPGRLMSAGYGGALNRRLKRFDLCLPEMLIRQSDGAALDVTGPIPVKAETTIPVSGKFALLTTDFVVATSKRKALLNRETGAELVDMETFAVAEVCRRREMPLLALRIILDTAGEELSDDLRKIMKDAEIGGVRLAGSLFGSLFRRPSSMLDLISLKNRALAASDRLAKRILRELNEQQESSR